MVYHQVKSHYRNYLSRELTSFQTLSACLKLKLPRKLQKLTDENVCLQNFHGVNQFSGTRRYFRLNRNANGTKHMIGLQDSSAKCPSSTIAQ